MTEPGGAPAWRRSGKCATSTCVEIRRTNDDEILMRDSKAPSYWPPLRFTRDEWVAFRDGVKAGEFDDL
jgi:Domain of unknown function (DUF397)